MIFGKATEGNVTDTVNDGDTVLKDSHDKTPIITRINDNKNNGKHCGISG